MKGVYCSCENLQDGGMSVTFRDPFSHETRTYRAKDPSFVEMVISGQNQRVAAVCRQAKITGMTPGSLGDVIGLGEVLARYRVVNGIRQAEVTKVVGGYTALLSEFERGKLSSKNIVYDKILQYISDNNLLDWFLQKEQDPVEFMNFGDYEGPADDPAAYDMPSAPNAAVIKIAEKPAEVTLQEVEVKQPQVSSGGEVDPATDTFGMVVASRYKMMRTSNLRFDPTYQRQINPQRVRELAAAMAVYGFLPSCPILVNDTWQIIDGQHRFEAAKKSKLTSVPVTVVRFPTRAAEAAFYWTINQDAAKNRLKPADLFHAKHESGEGMATLLYRLNQDRDSLLFNRIHLRNKTSENRLTITDACTIAWFAATGRVAPSIFNDKKAGFELSKMGYSPISENVNRFCSWVFAAYGVDKRASRGLHSKWLYALMRFHTVVFSQIDTSDNLWRAKFVKKMSLFNFNNLGNSKLIDKVDALINYYNNGRTKHRIHA